MKCRLTFLVAAFALILNVTYSNPLPENVNSDYLQSEPGSNLTDNKGVNISDYQYYMTMRLGTTIYDKKHFRYCGAVRLSERWVLTAAECLDFPRHLFIRITYPVGEIFKDAYRHRNDKEYLRYIIHPGYKPSTKENNIALIDASFLQSVENITVNLPVLPSAKDRYSTYMDSPAFITTYDCVDHFPLKEKGEGIYLKHKNTTVVDSSLCGRFYSSPTDKLKYICSSGAQGAVISKNDIGAPLLINDNGKLKLIGLATSNGLSTEEKRSPMMFTKIFPLAAWIRKATNNTLPN